MIIFLWVNVLLIFDESNLKFEETPSFNGKQVCEHRCQQYVHNH